MFKINPLHLITSSFLTCVMLLGIGSANAVGSGMNSAEALRAKYIELNPLLRNNQFKRPLYLNSVESSDHLKGDIYALVNYPFSTVNKALNNPDHWCEVLILHINKKYCHASTNNANSILAVSIGKKIYHPLDEAYSLEFTYKVATSTREYFNIGLNATSGPMGTSDYRIHLEAVSVPGGKTFLHLTYSYAYDYVGQIAMQAYLATAGSGKVGFTNTGDPSSGSPDYIGGVRGVVERNTMRYYLAIEAYLGALSTTPKEQLEKRLQNWFTSTEIYPQQLREIGRASYLDMKRREYQRQQKLQ